MNGTLEKFGPVLRIAAWGCIVLLALLSLLPSPNLHRTSLGGHVEHVLAYAGTALVIGCAYLRWSVPGIFAGLAAYAGVLEYLQHFAPGRVAALGDYAFSTLGVALGTLGALLVRRWLDACAGVRG